MGSKTVANLYNPHEQSKEHLIEHFVVRHNLLHRLYRDITVFKQTPPNFHYLIEGQRGMGKTTLLLRLKYEIESDPELQRWLIPIVFKEEAHYGIQHLSTLWEIIAQELETRENTFSELPLKMSKAYENTHTGDPQREKYEEACFKLLTDTLETCSTISPDGNISACTTFSKTVRLCVSSARHRLR